MPGNCSYCNICVSICAFCTHLATHRHQSEDCVDDPDSYGGVNWMSDTSSSEDISGIVKDLKEKTSAIFVLARSGHVAGR